jgi:hypothetical protein
MIRPGSLEDDIYTTPVGGLLDGGDGIRNPHPLPLSLRERGDSLGVSECPGVGCAPGTRTFDAPGETIEGVDGVCTGQLGEAENHQADGATAQDGDTVGDLELAQINGVEGNAKRFEQGPGGIAQAIGDREATPRRAEHKLLERAVVRPQTAEVETAAQVRMPHLTHLAAMTGGGRVYGDALAGHEWVVFAIARVFADGLYNSGKLVPQCERRFDLCIADTPIKVSVQIRTAHAYCRDPQ